MQLSGWSKLKNIFKASVFFLAGTFAMGSPQTVHAQEEYILNSQWRPSDQQTLATYAGDQISELDLTLFLLMKERDPSWIENWQENTLENAYRTRLKNAIREFIQTKELASTAESSNIETKIDPKKAGRILTGPAIAVSFADLVVKDQVEISNYDLGIHYRMNREKFVQGDGGKFNAVRDDIYNEVYPKLLRQQLAIAKNEAAKERYPINRANYLALLAPEVVILDVGKFELTRQEFFEVYPQGKEGPFRFKNVPDFIANRVEAIMHNESMIQELQDRSMLNQSWFSNAHEISTDIFLTQVYLTSPVDVQPSQEELESYVRQNREELFPSVSYVMWALESDSSRFLNETIERASQLFEERVAVAGEEAYALPNLVINRLLSDDNQGDTTFTQLPTSTAPEIDEQYGIAKSNLNIGSFTDARVLPSGRMQSLYFASTRRRTPPSQAEFFELAAEKIREDFLYSDVQEKITVAENNGTLSWSF